MRNFDCSSRQYGFSYSHKTSDDQTVSVSHIDKDLFSVFVLLDGQVDFLIESKRLHLLPGDVLLVGNTELHRSIFKKDVTSEYLLLMVNLDFFIKNNCTAFSSVVFNRTLGDSNIITAEDSDSHNILEILQRLDRYAGEQPPNHTVVSSVIVELLYHLNRRHMKVQSTCHRQDKIKDILEYINDHLTERLSLEDISDRFYLTKQYLCKLFKESTGFTVNNYIAYKRIVLTRERYLSGEPLSVACEKAGFANYTAFYRAYHKIMHEPPRKSLSEMNL